MSLPSHFSEETRGDINTSQHGRKQHLFEIDEELEARFDAGACDIEMRFWWVSFFWSIVLKYVLL